VAGHLARRLLFAVLLVFIASSAAFLLTRLAPGDYASDALGPGARPEALARTRARHGLDRPVLEHYAEWAGRAARLDLGTSLLYGRPVGELVASRLANTVVLGGTALVLATLVGFPLGVLVGSNALGRARPLVAGLSTIALSLPPLLTSLALVFVAARTGWLPVGGMTSAGFTDAGYGAWLADVLRHLPVPALALALPMAALIERMQARATADVLAAPHATAALARGVSRARLVWRHLVPLAARPVVAVYGLVAGTLLSGSFAVEIVTAWPGLGRLMVDALRARDVMLVAGCATAGALIVSMTNLAADLAVAAIDPRTRDGE
jgi:peptide/nickel transport system permease protein